MPAFIPRSEFAKLRLHEKNDYLQRMAEAQQAAQGRAGEDDFIPLSKEALSRLRRFYARRAFSDLRLEQMEPGLMRDSLVRMAEAIHGKELRKVLASEIPSPEPAYGPKEDEADAEVASLIETVATEADPKGNQFDFFVPRVHDAPLKDEMNLMDVAPFALSKVRRHGVIRYELKDSVVTIEGGAEVGLATAYDYDIFLSMVSYLAEEVRRYRIWEKKGRRPSLPPATYSPTASHLLRFCRRDLGGKQYAELENALDRLQATRIKITNLTGGKRRETQSFPMIGRYKVISRTDQDRVEKVEIEVPQWVYDGVVQPDGKPSILTLNPDYFLINQPIARFVYRLARKAAGTSSAYYTLDDLRYRSGSRLPPGKFRAKIESIVESTKTTPLPDYDLELRTTKRGAVLHMTRREEETGESMEIVSREASDAVVLAAS